MTKLSIVADGSCSFAPVNTRAYLTNNPAKFLLLVVSRARRGAGGPCSSTDEPIQTEPVSLLDRGGSRDVSPAISWPRMEHGSVDVLHRSFIALYKVLA